jgi:hypothetical protein
LEWAYFRCGWRGRKNIRAVFADAKPLLLVLSQFFRLKFPSTWVFVIIRVNFRVALEADGDCVLNSVGAIFTRRDNVIRLHLYATESVTDAAAPMDSYKQFVDVVSWKSHILGAA